MRIGLTSLSLGPSKRVVLLGGGRLLLKVVKWLQSEKREVFVITSPRHAEERCFEDSSFHENLLRMKVAHAVVAEWQDVFKNYSLDIIKDSVSISMGAAWIFKKNDIQDIFNNRLLNIHGTRLPQYRGGGGFSWQILNGSRLGFCVIHLIDGGVDTGDIISYDEFLYPSACRTPLDYQKYYEEKNFVFLQGFLNSLFITSIDFPCYSQLEYLSQYWPRLNSQLHSWIDWSLPTLLLERFICAFDDPYCGAQTFYNGKPVFIKKVLSDTNDGCFHPFQYGIVYRNNNKWLTVAADGGSLIIESISDVSGKDILQNIRVGDNLYTPSEYFEKKGNRVVYTPNGLKQN